jgi:hypothetical protein
MRDWRNVCCVVASLQTGRARVDLFCFGRSEDRPLHKTGLVLQKCPVALQNVGGPTFKVLLEVLCDGEITSKTCSFGAPAAAGRQTFPFWNLSEVSA